MNIPVEGAHFSVQALPNFPHIERGQDIVAPIIALLEGRVQDGSVLCVASKIVSLSEDRIVDLGTVTPSETARNIHGQVPRKDPRTIELMLQETGASDGSRLEVVGSWIGGTLPNGLKATSAGVDKFGPEQVILLPKDSDASAKRISEAVMAFYGIQKLGVIITDSDGRADRAGATQLAIGSFGIAPIRRIEKIENGERSTSEETLCDYIAGAAGILMGQRGTGKPVVVFSGIEFEFTPVLNMANDALLA